MSTSFISWVRSDLFLHSNDWAKARFEAQHRVRYVCEFPGCNLRGSHVHHIKPRWKYPLLALEPTNLRVLCARHHAQAHDWPKMPAHWTSYEPANAAQYELPFGESVIHRVGA
jgi:5-methylcytosine-specific restriction endonuclease McrA